MQAQNISNLSSDQRDQLLLQLLTEKAEPSENTIAQPASIAGKAMLHAVTEELDFEVNDGNIHEALSQAIETVEFELEETIWSSSDYAAYELSGQIESALTVAILGGLENAIPERPEMACDACETEMRDEIATALLSYDENPEFIKFLGDFRAALPELVEESVSWVIDTSALHIGVADLVRRFMTSQVVPNISRSICDTEDFLISDADVDGYSTEGLPSAVNDEVEQFGGADHG